MGEPRGDELEGLLLHRVTPDGWRSHRDLRLEMLQAAPDAFSTQYADVAAFDEQMWRARIRAQHHVQARMDGEPVGSVGAWDGPDTPDDAVVLVAMYVAPQARGRGIGERLVQAVVHEAARRGRRRVVLEVSEGNMPAIALYRRMGFRFTGARVALEGRPDGFELGMERAVGATDASTPVPDLDDDMGG